MQIPVVFSCVVFDTQRLEPLAATGFFDEPAAADLPRINGLDGNGASQSWGATDWEEARVTQWLLRDSRITALVASALGLPEALHVECGVTRPFLVDPRERPGDIDALLVDPIAPHRAAALEVKRVKVRPGERSDTPRITKLADVRHGVGQANALAAIGWSRTCLALVIIADGRAHGEHPFLWRGTSRSTLERVIDFPQRTRLDPEVGLLIIEVVQPTPRRLHEAAMVCIGVARAVTPREQPAQLTETLRRMFTSG